MSTLTIQNILRQIDELPLPEQRHLTELLIDRSAGPVSTKTSLDKRLPNQSWPEGDTARQWLREHANEYAGEWLALAGDRLIAHSSDRAAVRAAHQAAGFGNGDVVLHRVAAADEPPLIGI
ncbi:MAG: hypothetical protein HOP19_01465 [Acidobacteria bacterium]|nr:hypothetical protein [Acidobacteriota bacterium]